MSVDLTIESVHCEMKEFARRHLIDLPAVGERFTLGGQQGTGSYGGIHVVCSRNGHAPRTPLVAKLFELNETGIEEAEVVDRVRGFHVGLARGGAEVLEGLLATPFSLTRARVDGASRLVALMLDLTQLGYMQMPNDDDFSPFIKSASLGERIDYAYNYARCAASLERIGFTHGDQNLPNLMVNQQTADVQLIDFDLGVLVVNGDEVPGTEGKQDEFVPVEVKGDGSGLNKAPHTPAAERWSVGMLVTTLIFGHSPIFFMPVSASSVAEYAATGLRWPAIDAHRPPFVAGKERGYEGFRKRVEDHISSDIISTCADFFAAGLDGARRPTAADWVKALDRVRQPPLFLQTSLSSLLVLEGSEVTVTWQTSNAEHVEVPPLGVRGPDGEANVQVVAGTQVRLTAVNRWGSLSWTSPTVRAVPLPRIETIPVPGFPGLSIHVETPWPEFPLAETNPFPTAPPFDRAFSRTPGRVAGARLDGPAIPAFPPMPDVFSAQLVPRLRTPPEWRLPRRKREDGLR
jgi:serine/threonine protein kinase